MPRILTGARVLLALAVAGFALQYLRILPIAGPPWYPVHHTLSRAAGIFLLAAAAALLSRTAAHLAALLLGAALLVRVVVFHLPQLLMHLRDPNIWTGFGEVLALAAGAKMLAAALPGISTSFTRALATARYIFAATLVIFGVLHFMYAFFISTLIPAWIPQRFFFANFVGLCFIAAAFAIASGVRARPAAYMLAAMFLIWVAILHAPRVAASPHNGNEWTSMFIALAMAASSLAAAASSKASRPPP
jgi:uncharacterized membrane protein YphA (DoxX/SURF4 family)